VVTEMGWLAMLQEAAAPCNVEGVLLLQPQAGLQQSQVVGCCSNGSAYI